jgi:hypothetical protein
MQPSCVGQAYMVCSFFVLVKRARTRGPN